MIEKKNENKGAHQKKNLKNFLNVVFPVLSRLIEDLVVQPIPNAIFVVER
jgi:hypothetical protein